jgi:glucose/arabinose dehydrogenase
MGTWCTNCWRNACDSPFELQAQGPSENIFHGTYIMSRPLCPAMERSLVSRAMIAVCTTFLAVAASSAAIAQSPIPVGVITARLEPMVEGLNGVLTGNTVNTRTQMIPVDMSALGDGRQLVFTLSGHVRLLQANGTLAAGAYLDTYNSNSPPIVGTTGGEVTDFRQIGNTSIAAHPGFLNPQSRGHGKFYTITSELPDVFSADFDDGAESIVDSVVTEWSVTPSAVASTTQLLVGVNVSKREVLRAARPGIIHTVVDMAFAPDETLYITSGDGGGNAFPNTNGNAFGVDRWTNAQDPSNIFGSILRIDPLSFPNDTRPIGGQNGQYRIPSDNFGVADGDPDSLPETFAYGFRSPYRINIDPADGAVYVGDVGEGQREEINRVTNGGNFGWGAFEGTRIERPALVAGAAGALPPLFELYHNLNGQSESTNIVGGFVYRGTAIPALTGKYVFADVGEDNGGQPTNVVEIYYGDPTTNAASTRDNLFQLNLELPGGASLPDRIWSIAEDESGELYFLVGPDRLDLFNRTPGETDGGIWKLMTPSNPLNGIAGDVNQDGIVNGDGTGSWTSDDVTAFVAGWLTRGWQTNYDRFTHGDMNFDGRTNLTDWYILGTNHADVGSLDLAALIEGRNVPEPTLIASLVTACVGILARRRGARMHW